MGRDPKVLEDVLKSVIDPILAIEKHHITTSCHIDRIEFDVLLLLLKSRGNASIHVTARDVIITETNKLYCSKLPEKLMTFIQNGFPLLKVVSSTGSTATCPDLSPGKFHIIKCQQ